MKKKRVFRISWLVFVIVMGVFVSNNVNADVAPWPHRHHHHSGPWPDKPQPKTNKPRPKKPKDPRTWPKYPSLPKDVPDDPIKLEKLMLDREWKKKIRRRPGLWLRIMQKFKRWRLTWNRWLR